MKEVRFSARFEKDLDKGLLGPAELESLDFVLHLLERDEQLPEYLKDHPLQKQTANYAGLRECHLDADVLLIYRITSEAVVLHRVGTHRYLFHPGKAIFDLRSARLEKQRRRWRGIQ